MWSKRMADREWNVCFGVAGRAKEGDFEWYVGDCFRRKEGESACCL